MEWMPPHLIILSYLIKNAYYSPWCWVPHYFSFVQVSLFLLLSCISGSFDNSYFTSASTFHLLFLTIGCLYTNSVHEVQYIIARGWTCTGCLLTNAMPILLRYVLPPIADISQKFYCFICDFGSVCRQNLRWYFLLRLLWCRSLLPLF